MSHTRVIYTDSTTAECHTVLKTVAFQEDHGSGYFVRPDNDTVKIYLIWGRNQYYPEFHKKLVFAPRVQIHLKAGEDVVQLDVLARDVALALKNLDPNTRVMVFNVDSDTEMHI